MSWMKCCVFPLVLLCMWQLQEGAHACTCVYDHPQTQFCQSDVALKAKVVAKKAVGGNLNKDIKYDIKLTKILKGPKRPFDTFYTASSSAACGVILNEGVEYFITGKLMPDGCLYVSSCNYVVPWKSSHKILVERYKMGCDCKINRCTAVLCDITGPTECLWTDWLTGNWIFSLFATFPSMSWMKCCVFPLVLLCMWQLQDGAHACSCVFDHPQMAFCQSDVAIKAKVVAKKAVGGKYNDYIQYDIKQTKLFKGPNRHFNSIYTGSSSSACGVNLNKGVQYLITGQLEPNGSLYVSSCNPPVPWKSSHKILVERYKMGCDCQITRCYGDPCGDRHSDECLWTAWLRGNNQPVKQSACRKRSDGSCVWYKEAASPTKG